MPNYFQKILKRVTVSALVEKILFVLPFGVWVFAFRTFYSPDQGLTILSDARRAVISINYYLNHLLRGVYPFWGPFNNWGRPEDFSVRIFGEVNPFLYTVPVLKWLGCSTGLAFFIFLVGYFFLGVIGFYRLAREIFNEKPLAYGAMLMLLFSAVGTNVFNDILVILIFVPAVWFFYFLTAFAKNPRSVHFVGTTFTAMILAVTYIPYVFLTVFLTVAVFFSVLFPKHLVRFLKNSWGFCLKNKLIVALCIVSVIASVIPGLLYSQASRSGDYVASWRDPGAQQEDTISLSLDNINRGAGIVGSMSWERLVSELDIIPHLGFLYVPVFWMLLAGMGTILPVNRKIIFFLTTAFFFLGISMGGVFPLHKFLFEHIFFIRAFRNLHFFAWFAMASCILFLVEQFRLWRDMPVESLTKKVTLAVFVSAAHGGAVLFLLTRPHVIGSIYVGVLLSYGLFLGLIFLKEKKSACWISVMLLLLTAIPSYQVYQTIVYNSRKSKAAYTVDPYSLQESVPHFSFQRPLPSEPIERKKTEDFGEVFDTSGFIPADEYYLGLKWSYALHQSIPREILQAYVKDKFVAYDAVEYVEDKKANVAMFQNVLSTGKNLAIVEALNPKDPSAGGPSQEGSSARQIITKATQGFKVTDFDVNRIEFETDFPQRKFLVYNDSYHKDWIAFLNGKKVPLFKANVAFKGVWIPAGKNTVVLRFRPLSRYVFMYGLILVFALYLFYLLGYGIRWLMVQGREDETKN